MGKLYVSSVVQRFPESEYWTFGPYESLEECFSHAVEHCVLIGKNIVGTDQFEFTFEPREHSGIHLKYKTAGVLFKEINGFEISVSSLVKEIGVKNQTLHEDINMRKVLGLKTELDKLLELANKTLPIANK